MRFSFFIKELTHGVMTNILLFFFYFLLMFDVGARCRAITN